MHIKKQIGMVAVLLLASHAHVFGCQIWQDLGCAIANELQVSGVAQFCGPVRFKNCVEFCRQIPRNAIPVDPGELVFTSSDIMFAKCTVLEGAALDFPPLISPAMQTVFDFVYPCLADNFGLTQLRARPLFPSTDPDVSLLPTIDFKIPLDFDTSGWGIEVDAHILVARLVDGPLGDNDQVNVCMFFDWVTNALGLTNIDTCPTESAPATVVGEHCPPPIMETIQFGVVEPCQPDFSGTEEFQTQFRHYRITYCIPMAALTEGTDLPSPIAPGDWARLIFCRVMPESITPVEYEQPIYLNVVSVRYPRKCILLPTASCGGSECPTALPPCTGTETS